MPIAITSVSQAIAASVTVVPAIRINRVESQCSTTKDYKYIFGTTTNLHRVGTNVQSARGRDVNRKSYPGINTSVSACMTYVLKPGENCRKEMTPRLNTKPSLPSRFSPSVDTQTSLLYTISCLFCLAWLRYSAKVQSVECSVNSRK